MKAHSTPKSYQTGTKIKSVSNSPVWFLKLIGRIDAKKGEGVAHAHINRFSDRCTELEALECLTTESYLHETRKNGANALAIIAVNSDTLNNIPKPVEERSDFDIRANARRMAKIASAKEAISEARKDLFEINEKIINGDSILHERIIKTRKKARSKIDAYIKGVRSGGIKSFESQFEFSETALEAYHAKHKRLDDAINTETATFLESKENYNEEQ